MKHLILVLTVVSATLFAVENTQVVSILMVQDEASTIEKSLTALYEEGISELFVYDTGSSDETVAIAEALFEKWQLPNALVIQEKYINQAESRNRALQLAKQFFPIADFFLMPDSGWVLKNGRELLGFCNEEIAKGHPNDAYLIRIAAGHVNHYAGRLINSRSDSHFVGEVDEMLLPAPQKKAPFAAHFVYGSKEQNRKAFFKKTEGEIEILKKSFAKNPHDPRTVFSLAQNYSQIGDQVKAYDFCKKRIQMQGDPEEKFLAMYRLAQITEGMGSKEHDTWGEAMEYYLEAYKLRSHRIEPLVRIALHYLSQKDYANTFLFAIRTLDVPYPENDRLYIEAEFYEFTRYNILSLCSYYVGEMEVGLKAILEALKVYPNEAYLHKIYNFYHIDERKWIKAHPEKYKRELLVTGCCRSGTLYTSELLTKAGFKMGHEYLDVRGLASWLMTSDANAVPWGPAPENIEFAHIFHQVREPLKCIGSIQTEPEESWIFASEQVPEIDFNEPLLVKSAKLWYYWNLKAEEKAEFTYRVEEIENVWGEWEKRLGVKLDRSALSQVPKNVNSRPKKVKTVTWEMLKEALEPELFANIQALARRYGYSVP